jgi:hypothetical protein
VQSPTAITEYSRDFLDALCFALEAILPLGLLPEGQRLRGSRLFSREDAERLRLGARRDGTLQGS